MRKQGRLSKSNPAEGVVLTSNGHLQGIASNNGFGAAESAGGPKSPQVSMGSTQSQASGQALKLKSGHW